MMYTLVNHNCLDNAKDREMEREVEREQTPCYTLWRRRWWKALRYQDLERCQ